MKSQWLDQMQLRTGIGAKADDVAGIRGNLRLMENDFEHLDQTACLVGGPASLFSGRYIVPCAGGMPGNARATTQAWMLAAPRRRMALASSFKVAPLVMTSSTIATSFPERSIVQVKARRMFRCRCFHGSSVWEGVSRVREQAWGNNVRPVFLHKYRLISSA